MHRLSAGRKYLRFESMNAVMQNTAVDERETAMQSPAVATEVLAGLGQSPKQISPKYFYDQKGSKLFDAITELDEYYVPHVEQQIFEAHGTAICAAIGAGVTLIEPGAGSCEKVKWLLPKLAPAAYVPMDISADHLRASAAALSNEFTGLRVLPQSCDHTVGVELEHQPEADAPPVFFYPGSSIGNFTPAEAVEFLRGLRALMDKRGGLLIGVDTKKDTDVLHAAYNDSAGVTAQFNLNMLDNLNNLLDGNLDTKQFAHHALYNENEGRIEMHLRCTSTHAAELAGQPLSFSEGELVQTEYSYKYHPDEFSALAARAGFARRELWQDNRGWFSVMYFEPV
jgi:dimethylhistidine N-methyltransferase